MVVYPFVLGMINKFSKNDSKIIDFGCGEGLYETYLTNLGHRYLGLDKLVPKGPFKSVDIRSTNLPSNSSDLIFGVATFYFVGPTAFKEAYRLLNSGGKLLIFDYKKKVLNNINKNHPELNIFCWNVNEIEDELHQIGFDNIRQVSYKYPYRKLRILSIDYFKHLIFSSWIIIVAEKN